MDPDVQFLSKIVKKSNNIAAKKLEKGALLFKEGSRGRELFVLKEGRLGVYKNSHQQEAEIEYIDKGGVVGEMALLDRQPYSATVRVIEDSEVFIINGSAFRSALKESPKVLTSLIKIIISRLRKANNNINQSVLKNPKNSLVSLILILFPEYRYEYLSCQAMEYDKVISEAYYTSGLQKRKTEKFLHLFGKIGIVKIKEDSDKKKHLCFPDIEIFRLYHEYLILKNEKRNFKEDDISGETLSVLSELEYFTQNSCNQTGEEVFLSKNLFYKNIKEQNQDKTENGLHELKKYGFIDIFPENDDSTIVFMPERCKRLEKIKKWLPKFKMDLS